MCPAIVLVDYRRVSWIEWANLSAHAGSQFQDWPRDKFLAWSKMRIARRLIEAWQIWFMRTVAPAIICVGKLVLYMLHLAQGFTPALRKHRVDAL